ncbi:hypothetical protein Tco_0595969 [Tanacetum coccineum]
MGRSGIRIRGVLLQDQQHKICVDSTPWFADFANYHAGNFIVIGDCHPSRKKVFQRCKNTNLDDPFFVQNLCGSIDPAVWCTAKKLSHSRSLLQWNPTGGHSMVQISRQKACENSLIYKEKTKRIHDAKIKNRVFNIGDQVLLFNSRLKIFSGKLKSRWSGPFTIVQVFPYGTVELSQNSGPNFKVNGHHLKHYFGGDVPAKDIPDLQTFPKDN